MAMVLRRVRINARRPWLPEVLTVVASVGLSVGLMYWVGFGEADEPLWKSWGFWWWSSAGPVLAGPALIGLRVLHSKKRRLFFGELCWIAMTLPWLYLIYHFTRAEMDLESRAYLVWWFGMLRMLAEPVLACAAAIVLPCLPRRPRPWTHYAGFGLLVYEALVVVAPIALPFYLGI